MNTPSPKPERFWRIYGLSWPLFLLFGAVVMSAAYLGRLPDGMIGALPLMIVIGAVFNLVGDHAPIVKSFLGGGPIVIIFGSAALVAFNCLPAASVSTMTTFMQGGGFLDFYISALIAGSIMGMSRQLLLKAALRYLPVILGAVAVAVGLGAAAGALTGYGAKQAVFFIAIPVMGGGMGAGAVPMSKIFGDSLGTDPARMLSMMVPAVTLANALAIVCGGLCHRLGLAWRSVSGDGRLLKAGVEQAAPEADQAPEGLDLVSLGVGLLTATVFFVFGALMNMFFPAVHGYAWMIFTVAAVKVSGRFSRRMEACCWQWFQFVMKNLTGVLLVGIGVAYTNLHEVVAALTPQYLVLVGVTVLGAIAGAATVGRLVGFYPLEAAITGGLCMANMGGTGDVAVLSAAKRMELMPFAQISSRIGGAFMLVFASVMLQIFG
ncbi:MAG: 2-hydroxycarboxylate transporter family protein [Deltaproteobacteria bacterium]|jgi:Na+/citrate or Na+/malate symporter|nr:2-hydroxycarboxylate transporter family protein [Deltaproteobacteria bacterium]